ncbi:MAG: hypothetical protein ACR2PJ_00875, partial [Pseudomonadales bacterium]
MQRLAKTLFAVALTLSALLLSAAEELTQEQIEARLKQIEASLAEQRQQLEATLDKKSAAETELRRNEKLISDLLNRIRRIEQQL